MSFWEARASRGTAPAQRVDGELRYRLVAPLVRDAALWVDLGAGTGIQAAAALGENVGARRTLLVDHDADALQEAARELRGGTVETLRADLAAADGTAAVREAVPADGGPVLVTCFDVLHQLEDFTALVELLIGLGEGGATVVLSVPDDAAGALQDPHRASAWSAGAAEELRRLLPAGAVALKQVAVRASAIVGADGATVALPEVAVAADDQPTAHLLAFGPDVQRLTAAGHARAADLEAERAEARRSVSDLAYLEARLAALEAPASS